jgi:uncharacterized protein
MDELTAPLGQNRAPRRRSSVPRALAILVGISLLGTGLWVAVAKHPFHKPMAAAPAAPAVPAAAVAPAVQANVPPAQPPAEPDRTGAIREPADASGRRTVIIIDGMSGKRQEVLIGSPEPAPDAVPGQKPR